MITQIGIIAGEIWHYLDTKGESKFSEMDNNLDYPQECILMSLGWLAREGHVNLDKDDKDWRISLNN